MSLPLGEIVKTLAQYPSLYDQISIDDITHFLNLTKLLKPYLSLTQSVYLSAPPDCLPQYIHGFLVAALGIDGEVVKLLWAAFRHYIWGMEWNEEVQRNLGNQYIAHFLREGLSRNISTSTHTSCYGLLSNYICQPFTVFFLLFGRAWTPSARRMHEDQPPSFALSNWEIPSQCRPLSFHATMVPSPLLRYPYTAGVRLPLSLSEPDFLTTFFRMSYTLLPQLLRSRRRLQGHLLYGVSPVPSGYHKHIH